MVFCTNTLEHPHAPRKGSRNGNCYVCAQWRHNELALGVPATQLKVSQKQHRICDEFVSKCMEGSCLRCRKAAKATFADLASKSQEQGIFNLAIASDIASLKSDFTTLASSVLNEGQVRSIGSSLVATQAGVAAQDRHIEHLETDTRKHVLAIARHDEQLSWQLTMNSSIGSSLVATQAGVAAQDQRIEHLETNMCKHVLATARHDEQSAQFAKQNHATMMLKFEYLQQQLDEQSAQFAKENHATMMHKFEDLQQQLTMLKSERLPLGRLYNNINATSSPNTPTANMPATSSGKAKRSATNTAPASSRVTVSKRPRINQSPMLSASSQMLSAPSLPCPSGESSPMLPASQFHQSPGSLSISRLSRMLPAPQFHQSPRSLSPVLQVVRHHETSLSLPGPSSSSRRRLSLSPPPAMSPLRQPFLPAVRDDVARIAECPVLLKEFLTRLEAPCDEIDRYKSHPGNYTKQQKKQMEGRVTPGRDAQGKLALVVLAHKAGRLEDLSAHCALRPGLFGTIIEDAVLRDRTDSAKQHLLEAKTCGWAKAKGSARYYNKTRWLNERGAVTGWDSTLGFLHPQRAAFRIFETTGATLDQIFGRMANSGYEVILAHRPKLVECARANKILRPDRELPTTFTGQPFSQSDIPIKPGEGLGSQGWFNGAIERRFTFKALREDPSLLAQLFPH